MSGRGRGDPHEVPVTSAAVSVRDLVVDLGSTRVLDGVSLRVEEGAWVSVVGPNGAGKTTLLRAVADLVDRSGTVSIGGVDLDAMAARERSRSIALVPQNPVVPPGTAVVDYVLLGRTPHIPFFGIEGRSDLDIVAGVLEQLELEAFAHRPIDTLSGGERQRAVLARALAQQAPVLLLDEPTTALDVGHQQEVLELVDELRRVRGFTVLSTMHDLTVAGQYGERLVLLDGGRVVAAGLPTEVLTEELLERHYGARVRVLRDGDAVAVVPLRRSDEVATESLG